ncbi:MAG: NlpC/P60 family protein [Desulfobacterales bacterium]
MLIRLLKLTMTLLMIAGAGCAGRPAATPSAPPSAELPQYGPVRLAPIQYTIQVGAFSTTEGASAYADYLETFGLDAYYFVDDDRLFKVRLERFDTRESARRRAGELQTGGLIDDYYIVHPNDDVEDRTPEVKEKIVQTALRYIGLPYRWGGASVKTGFDCSGLTMTVYRLHGMDLPRTAASQFQAGTPVDVASLQKGDLVFFRTTRARQISHVGIYSGDRRFIHAPGKGRNIRTSSLDNRYYSSRFVGARRYFQ